MLIFVSVGKSDHLSPIIEPTYLSNYNETLLIQSNGTAISHIDLQLADSSSEFYLPLLLNTEVALVEVPREIEARILGESYKKYLLLSSKDGKPLSGNIRLDISYANILNEVRFWEIEDDHIFLFDYSDIKNRKVNMGEFSAKITLLNDLCFDIRENGSEDYIKGLVSVDFIEDKECKVVNLKGSNLNFIDIDFEMEIDYSSSILIPYILVIVLLITIYVVFLRYVFVG